MSSSEVEVIDVNVVVLLSTPLTKLTAGPELLESEEFKATMKAPSVGQGFQIDPTSGAVSQTVTIESMRSQKSVVISPNRIEVHDRSGRSETDVDGLVRLLTLFVRALELEISSAGTNMDIAVQLSSDQNASFAIARALFQQRTDYIPQGTHSAGGTAKLIFAASEALRYTIGIEPRYNSQSTTEVWMSSNANLSVNEMPSSEELAQLVRDNRDAVTHVAQALFPIS